jgi:hypothetical protein
MTAGAATPSDREILARLLDATPLPTPGCDVEPLLAMLDAILAARDEILAQIVPPLHVTDADRALLDELSRREALWQQALCDAQHRIGTQRCGASPLRAYAPTI